MSVDDFEALVALEESVEKPLKIFSQLQLVGNIFLAYGLKYLWNMVNLFQFLVFFRYWKINVDPTA